jgi:serine/threonine protein kinase
MVEQKRGAPIGKKSYSASVVSIPADSTYDIWAYGVVLYEALAGLPLGPYACRGKRAMSASEVCKIGMWDDNSMKKALKHVPDNGMIRELLKGLLHHDPKKRVSSMRQVLEHPFFSGGTQDAALRIQQVSPSNNTFSTASPGMNSLSQNGQMFPQQSQQQFMDQGFGSSNAFDDIKFSQSGESIENRENGVRSGSSTSGNGRSSSESVRSVRSFGGGFRKIARNTFRGGNGNSSQVR